jgi:dolichol-phosphate mannosyltransferase
MNPALPVTRILKRSHDPPWHDVVQCPVLAYVSVDTVLAGRSALGAGDDAQPRPALSVVVAVYNEERSIEPFLARLVPVVETIGAYEIIFCLDPSSDATEQVIVRAIETNPRIALLVFSRRFGQPAAVMAGLRYSTGETCVVIDVDLQDPPELIVDLYRTLRDGFDVVAAQRRSRKGETLMKRAVASAGYRLINAVSDVRIPPDTGDFRIMSRRVVDEVCALKEGHGFLRGLVAFVGYRQTQVEYDRDPRAYGAGKYNRFWGSLRIGFNGLFGFSNVLLNLTLLAGLVVCGAGFLATVYLLVATLGFNQGLPLGTALIVVLALFLGGVQLISVGILGQYVGRIYDEVRHRPPVLIDRIIRHPQHATATDPGSWRGPSRSMLV